MKDCDAGGTCGYYAYLQGTSMASPHATGVSALAVSRFGTKDPRHKGEPPTRSVEDRVRPDRGRRRACLPGAAAAHYTNEGRSAEFNALCEGTTEFNGFYGYGIVDAYATVTEKFEFPD